MDNVTALIKTFLRDDTVFLCIESLRKQFPDMPIIVADDGRPSYVKESFMRGNNIEYYLLPFNRGLPKGRNFLIDKCPTRFCLIGDDDFYYTPCAQLEALLKLMSVADLAGGATIENGQVKHFEGFIHIEDGRMRLEALTTDDMSEIDSVRYKRAGVVPNFFIARIDALRHTRWDENIMMHEHFDFFLRFIADGHTVVYAPDSRVHHGYRPPQPLYKDNYSDFRHFNRTDQVYLTRKWNLKGANLNDRAIEPSGLAAEDSLACPLPELSAEDKVLSCRHWGEHNGTEYWVRVYDRGDVIYKQATLNLAEREARFLRRLNGEYFPRVLNCETGDGYSTITLEKVHGTQPNKCDDTINAHNIARHRFILGCVEILWKLRNTGITHRGIVRENLVVRDGKPVLLDFIWAVSGEDPYFTPVGLARSPEREFCDLYSMGKVLEEVSDGRCPAADAVIKMMTEEFSDSRMLNLDILKLLFSCACEIDGCDGESEPREYKSALYEILTRGFRTKPLQLGYIDRHVQMAEKAAREIVQLVPWDTTIILVDSAQTEIHRWLDRRPCLPMMEKGARYWGAPADGQAAICEIERLKTLGARFAVFAWPALWWLDHYSEMTRWLRDSFKCVLENERLVIFDLRQRGTLG